MANPAVESRRLQVASMRRAGHTIEEIARECSVSKKTIAGDLRHLRNLGTDLGQADAFVHQYSVSREPGAGDRLVKQEKALELRKTGMSYSAIGRQLGCSQKTAEQYVSDAVATVRAESVGQIREVAAQRLDLALSKCIELLDHIDPHVRLKAVARLVTVEAERAKLFGTYVPIRVDATVTEVTQQDLELQQMITEAQAEIAAQEQQLREGADGGQPAG